VQQILISITEPILSTRSHAASPPPAGMNCGKALKSGPPFSCNGSNVDAKSLSPTHGGGGGQHRTSWKVSAHLQLTEELILSCTTANSGGASHLLELAILSSLLCTLIDSHHLSHLLPYAQQSLLICRAFCRAFRCYVAPTFSTCIGSVGSVTPTSQLQHVLIPNTWPTSKLTFHRC